MPARPAGSAAAELSSLHGRTDGQLPERSAHLHVYGFGIAGGHWGGTLADELAVPFADAMLVRLADGIDPVAAASVADNVSDAYRHVVPYVLDLQAYDPDAAVLILAGVGRRPVFTPSVVLNAGQIAHALGARNVTLVDRRPAVRAAEDKLGLHAIPPAELKGHAPAPLVIDVTTEPRGHLLALRSTAPNGFCSNAGSLHLRARIPIERYRRVSDRKSVSADATAPGASSAR